jgi:hypothetical protein
VGGYTPGGAVHARGGGVGVATQKIDDDDGLELSSPLRHGQ